MSTTTFRRHHRVLLDAAIHRVFSQLGNRHGVRDAFAELLAAARARSDIFEAAAVVDGGVRRFLALEALYNLARFHARASRWVEAWRGAEGHPLAVIDSLARHLFARYPTPRFLASVWFGDSSPAARVRREWFIGHAAGQRFRGLRLPMVMTRRMEHWFLRTPDHVGVDVAMRRAEVLGLGGGDALVEQVIATRLVSDFTHGAYWRDVLAWLVRREDELAPGDVGVLVEHLAAIRETAPVLVGRTVASVKRDDLARRFPPRRARSYASAAPRTPLAWPKSQWADVRCDEYLIVELLSSEQLAAEGRGMRHCVASYDWRCHQRASTIWSMRAAESGARILTIEVDPKIAAIVMVRGAANRGCNDDELETLSTWAARLGLGAAGSFARDLEARGVRRAS